MFGSCFPPEVLDFVPSNALANAQAGMTSDRVSIVDTDVVMVRVSFEAGLGDNVAAQATLTIRGFAANSGGTGTVITFSDLWLLRGNLTFALSNGVSVRQTWTTNQSSYQTLVTDGAKQLQVLIPIRTRNIPKGLNFLECAISGLGAARSASIDFVRARRSGPVPAIASVL